MDETTKTRIVSLKRHIMVRKKYHVRLEVVDSNPAKRMAQKLCHFDLWAKSETKIDFTHSWCLFVKIRHNLLDKLIKLP